MNLRNNMILGAIFASGLTVLGLGVIGESLFHPHYPEKPQVPLDLTAAAPAAGGGAADKAPPPDFGLLFADATALDSLVRQGDAIHKQCVQCHSFEPGGANKIGPALYGVFGRTAGGLPGFNYSGAMKEYAKEWSYQNLYDYLAAPQRYVKGTTMAFGGIRRSEDRVALVAYLRSLAPSPAPLPPPLPQAEAPAPPDAGVLPAGTQVPGEPQARSEGEPQPPATPRVPQSTPPEGGGPAAAPQNLP